MAATRRGVRVSTTAGGEFSGSTVAGSKSEADIDAFSLGYSGLFSASHPTAQSNIGEGYRSDFRPKPEKCQPIPKATPGRHTHVQRGARAAGLFSRQFVKAAITSCGGAFTEDNRKTKMRITKPIAATCSD
jgi:hypothetical protein